MGPGNLDSCILVTGANGFVGSDVVRALLAAGHDNVISGVREGASQSQNVAKVRTTPELSQQADWRAALSGVTSVVHCAARVHVMRESLANPIDEFRRVNVQGTLQLAKQCAELGVSRFVFVSSVKVNGEQSLTNCPFRASDLPNPQDPYAISKYEAESALLELARKTSMQVVIVRPPLVYGPGVRANFLSMMRWLSKGVPLPLGAIDNKRSLVFIENLSSLLVRCSMHPNAANRIFLVSDDEDLSTTELVRQLARAMGTRPYLVPVPASLIKVGARLLGKGTVAQRLCGNLQVEIHDTKAALDWKPPTSVRQALHRTALAFLDGTGS